MERLELSKRDIKDLLKDKSKRISFNCFNYNGKLLKINIDFLDDFGKLGFPGLKNYGIDPYQIRCLSELQPYVSSSLPCGTVYFKNTVIGVIYPKIFYDYQDFNQLNKEELIRFYSNIRKAVVKHIELISNDIYNTDLKNKNILYNGDNVELIDLDGKYIKFESHDTYHWFLEDLRRLLIQRAKIGHERKEFIDIANEINEIFKYGYYGDVLDFPLQLVNKVEKMHVLK